MRRGLTPVAVQAQVHAKVSFRTASASGESVFGVQTNAARKIHRSDHTEGPLTTAPSGCCVRKGTRCGHSASIWRLVAAVSAPVSRKTRPVRCRSDGASTGTPAAPALKRERDGGQVWRAPWDKEDPCPAVAPAPCIGREWAPRTSRAAFPVTASLSHGLLGAAATSRLAATARASK